MNVRQSALCQTRIGSSSRTMITACRHSRARLSFERWGSKTAAQLVARFQEAKFSFKEAGLTDDEDIVRITAYVLQVNGAKPGSQALTRDTGTAINSVVEFLPGGHPRAAHTEK